MKKFRIFAVIVLALVLVLGTIQFCIADPFNVDVEGEGDNVKLVFTLNGKKYELNLNPYTGNEPGCQNNLPLLSANPIFHSPYQSNTY